jgi:ATP-binding protein involved in chromosome partitioning
MQRQKNDYQAIKKSDQHGGYIIMSSSCGMKDEQRVKQDEEIDARLKQIRNKILVMSGKGGVGKSSVAAYLSLFLAKKGYKVGLMDVDLHGPSIPRMLGVKTGVKGSSDTGKMLPVSVMPNLHIISIEALMGDDKDAALIWRGPVKIGVIRQFISDIQWPELDYLIIDSPPGTGDEPLTVAQTIPDAKALIVTTPQEVSLADVRKSINFCRQMKIEILGLVENMSGLICPHCGKSIDLFKKGGGMSTALSHGLRLLATLPIEPELVKIGDSGDISKLNPDTLSFAGEFKKLVDQVEKLTA